MMYNYKYFFCFDLSCVLFFFLNLLWIFFDPYDPHFQFVFSLNIFDFLFIFGVDGFSLFFVYLSGLLICLSMLYSFFNLRKNSVNYVLVYNGCIFFIFCLLILVFFSLDLLFFYFCFEMILMPFFTLIGISSYRKRRIHASYLFFFFTIFGSFLMLFSLFQIYSIVGSTNIEVLFNQDFGFFRENFLWILLFLSLAVKVPMFPFHIWLPEAHVEAPTEGSVLLAGVLLKLGTYGILRFLFPIFPFSSYYLSPIAILLACLSIFYTSFVNLRQVDIKRIIAYSSISHMNMCILGLFSFYIVSVVGSIHLMLAHGVVSGGLFFLVGILYNRYHTKILNYYGGIVYIMPIYSFFLFLFVLGNVSFPLTSNFVGEFLIILGLSQTMNFYSLFFYCVGIFICSVYTFFMYNRVVFLLPKYSLLRSGFDLTFIELMVLIPLTFFVFWLGVYPLCWTNILEYNVIYHFFFIVN